MKRGMEDLISRIETIQDEPDYLVILENKEVLQKQKYGACQRDTGTNLEELPIAKDGTICTIK